MEWNGGIQSTTLNTPFCTSASGDTAISGLSVTITPLSANSKILVMYSTTYDSNIASRNSAGGFRIFKNGAHLTGASGSVAGTRMTLNADLGANKDSDQSGMHRTGLYLDSPGSVAAQTYDLRIYQALNTFTTCINRGRADSDNGDDPRMASTITVIDSAYAAIQSFTLTTPVVFSSIIGVVTEFMSGISVSITPSSRLSKFLVMYSVNFDCTQPNQDGGFRLYRNGVLMTSAVGSNFNSNNRYLINCGFQAYVNADQSGMNCAGHIVDAPATSTTITYEVSVLFANLGSTITTYINRARTDVDSTDDPRMASSITVIEISA
jgi:hypothetical protein